MKHKQIGTHAGMILANIFSSGTSIFVKGASSLFGTYLIGAIRYPVQGLIYLIIFPQARKRQSAPYYKQLMINSALMIVMVFAWLQAISRTQAIEVIVVALLTPVFVYIGSVVFLKERPNKRSILGTITALLGALILFAEPIYSSVGRVDGDISGSIYNLISAIAFAAQIVQSKNVLKHVSETAMLAHRSLIVGFVFILLSIFTDSYGVLSRLELEPVLYLAAFIIIPGVFGNMLFFRAIKKMKVEAVSSYMYIEPLIGVLLGYTLLGERFSVLGAIGAVTIVSGVVIAHPIHMHSLAHYRHPNAELKQLKERLRKHHLVSW
ncbi:MAG: drug/metabolite transporter (DMT)-like permease [Candidatus Saccharimonadales bacterium]|jgi:drug/metabolite transporter (DMT)-like permease